MKCHNYSECSINNAVFAFTKADKIRFCKKHRLDKMVDVVNPKCLDCGKQPVFNIKGSKKGIYCDEHKLDGMVDVHTKRCEFIYCETQPVFNKKGTKTGIYCFEHKLDGMVDVVSKHCEDESCEVRASYNIEGAKTGKFCVDHKLDGMIDIMSKRCEREECNIIASYNIKGLKTAKLCAAHKSDDMVSVTNPLCNKCDTIAVFNIPGSDIGAYCFEHKLPGMIDVKNKQCVNCNMTAAITHYDDHCYGCFTLKYPDHPRVRNYKFKEQAIMSEIANAYPEIVLDKAISGGKSRKRPDGLIDSTTHVIIVEVDENQHKDYNATYDSERTMLISQDLDHRPVVFIRVNPDKYVTDGKTIPSAFTLTKATGKLKVKPKVLEHRIDTTLKAIEKHLNTIPDQKITVESLFFDGYADN